MTPPGLTAAPSTHEVVANALSGPSRPPAPEVIARVAPPLGSVARQLSPSRVAAVAAPAGVLTVGEPTDSAERMAERVAQGSTAVPAGVPPIGAGGGAAPGALAIGVSRGAVGAGDPRAALGAVQIHTGELAERSADAIGADGYAVGGHVVLGRRRSADQVADHRLLAHELAHAVAEPAGGTVIRRQPKTPPPPPETYDTGAQTFSAATMTTADIRTALAAKQTSGDLGPGFRVVGATAGSQEERFLLNVLLQRAEKANWNSELDAVTDIGPAPQGGTAPRGQVSVAIDAAGNATVTLVSGTVPALATQFADVAAARAALIKNFGFSAVRDGSATWTLPELIKAYEALQRLSTADRDALHGVSLVREATITLNGQSLSGEFHHEQSVPTGGTTVTDERELRIADSAFANDAISFIGGTARTAPMSFETILHEAGHAVEVKAQLDATRAQLDATAERNTAVDADNVQVAAFNAEVAATNTAVGTANAAANAANAAFKTYTRAQQTAAAPAISALDTARRAIDAFSRVTGSDPHPPAEADAQKAIAARDTAMKALPAGHPASGDFAALVSAQDAWFAAAQRRAAAGALRAGTKSKVDTAQKTVDTTKQAASATKVTPKGASAPRTRRLQTFVDFVNAQHIKPLTAYAATNWPANPEEFFAEAFSLWLNDPDYLAAQAPALKGWFDAGSYRM